jgi:hypothetical protein
MLTAVLGTSKLRVLGEELPVPFFAGCCGGGATAYAAATLSGAGADLSLLAGLVGFAIGSFSAIPKPYTCFCRAFSLSLVGAAGGTATALVGFFTADAAGWVLALTVGLALIGLLDGLCAPVEPPSRRSGLVSRLVLEWASRGAMAGLLVAAITGLVLRGGDAAQAKLALPVCLSLLLFVGLAGSYALWTRQRKPLPP